MLRLLRSSLHGKPEMYLRLEILGYQLEFGKILEEEEQAEESFSISDFPQPIVSSVNIPSDPIGFRLYSYEEDE